MSGTFAPGVSSRRIHERNNKSTDLPWTMTKLTEDLGAHQFDDLTDQVPAPMEFQQACEEEQAPPLRPVRRKRAVPECPRPSREVSGLEESDQFGHLVSEELQEGFQDH